MRVVVGLELAGHHIQRPDVDDRGLRLDLQPGLGERRDYRVGLAGVLVEVGDDLAV
jgi:hypothetical protein